MDLNDIRSAVTVLSMLVFVGICAWAWSRRNQADFDAAARLPFQDEQDR
jgi:cytochrome c oxidase cbb3-type subunit 4